MDQLILFGIALVAFVITAGAISGLLTYYLLKYRTAYYNACKKLVANLEVDLELATTEQLFGELRRRPKTPWVLMLPTFTADGANVTLEVRNMPPEIARELLKNAVDGMGSGDSLQEN